MNRTGKIGKRNINANKILKRTFQENGIERCEMCGSTYMLSFAHKSPREHYRSNPEGLYDINEVLLLCTGKMNGEIGCHQKMDDMSLTSEEEKNEIFRKLRG